MKKSNLYGIIGSATLLIIIFLLLWFIILPAMNTPEEEGLIVSFGETTEGSGMTETPVEATPTKVAMPEKPVKETKQEYLTQSDNSLAIAENKKKEKERKEQELIEKQRLVAEQIAADKKRKEQDAINKANSMNGMFGNNNSAGSGTTTGESMQGNPVGKGSSGGNSWSLNGRNLTGRLVTPSYDKDVEGKITVNIRVNQNGNVISTSIGSPTTISEANTRNAAMAAAQNTHFSSGKDISAGSITYNFNLR